MKALVTFFVLSTIYSTSYALTCSPEEAIKVADSQAKEAALADGATGYVVSGDVAGPSESRSSYKYAFETFAGSPISMGVITVNQETCRPLLISARTFGVKSVK